MFRALATKERTAYFLCCLAGVVTLVLLRQFSWAAWAGMMVTYNAFLAWLILFDEKKRRPSHNVSVTIVGHLFCVALLITLKYVVVMAVSSFSHAQPLTAALLTWYFRIRLIRLLFALAMYGMAFWERDWLFGGDTSKSQHEPKGAAAPMLSLAVLLGEPNGVPLQPATPADHEAWLKYTAQNRSKYDPRYSPKDDYERWLRARGKTMYPVTANDRAPAGD